MECESERGHCAQGPLSWFCSKCHFVNNTVSVVPSLNIIYDKNESKASEPKNESIHLTCRVNRKPLKVIQHLETVRPKIKMYINPCCLKPVRFIFPSVEPKRRYSENVFVDKFWTPLTFSVWICIYVLLCIYLIYSYFVYRYQVMSWNSRWCRASLTLGL